MTRFATAAAIGLLGAVVLSGSGRQPMRATDDSATLAIPGRRNANASIAAAGDFVAVIWGASTGQGTTDIVTAVSRDGGRTFGVPVRVNDGAADVRLSGEQPPRVSLVPRATKDPSIVTVWTARQAEGTRLMTARSDDGGRTFGRPAVVPGSAAAGNRGWESMAVDPGGHVVVAWLDHRELAAGAAMTHRQHLAGHDTAAMDMDADGPVSAQRSKLYLTGLDGRIKPQAIARGVCYCCKTALATGPDGAIYAAWREVYPGDIRDIAFTMSRDGGRSVAAPVRVSDDHWVLKGCPENGPAIAVDHRSVVHIVWPTLVNGAGSGGEPTLALFYAATSDGRHFSPRWRIPTDGVPRHAWIASGTDGALLMAWDEGSNGTRRVAIAEATPDGQGGLHLTRVPVSGTQDEYPVATAVDGGFVAAWTHGSAERSVIQVVRLVRH